MNLFALFGLLNGLGATWFGIVGIKKRKEGFLYQIFAALNFTLAYWSYSYFFWLISNNYSTALFWVGNLSLGANFIPIIYLHWIVSLLKLNKRFGFFIRVGYLITFLFSLFSFSHYYVKDLYSFSTFSFWPVAGSLYIYYIIFLYIGIAGFALLLLITAIIKMKGIIRTQSLYVFIGSVLGLGGGFLNFLPWYGVPVKPFLNIGVIFGLSFWAYAMVKHRFMDIRFVLRQGSVYAASIVTIIIVVLISKIIFYSLFSIRVEWADYIYLAVGVIVFPYLRNYYFRIANQYFFSSIYDDRAVIAKISEKLRTTLQLNKIYQYISDTLVQKIHIKRVAVLTYSKEFRKYISEYKHGFTDAGRELVFGDEWSHKQILPSNQAILYDELRNKPYVKYKKLVEFMRQYEIELIIPLSLKDRSVGLLLLGAKESGDSYNQRDIEVLEIIGAQAAISMQNAHHYEEIRNFSQKLEKEVEIATRDLREANEKLQKLDKAKSEFISIASHQLRTPLTVIKGYISMILQGNFGHLDKNKKESLQKVYESNERLIQLVENLLNISRIESGRMQLDFTAIHLQDLVTSVVDELTSAAARKGLKLEYRKPKKRLPLVTVDEEKLRQAVINIIDNAIKYTSEGKVSVEVLLDGDYLKLCVTDTGAGIKKTELPELFKKFTRGRETPLLNTEGTGLGLYVAKQMINLHKGKIWAKSEGEGKGSRFCFLIPANK